MASEPNTDAIENLGQSTKPPEIRIEDVPLRILGNNQEEDDSYKTEATRLRKLLKLYFYAAFKWKDHTCSFHLVYCFVFLLQAIKVSLITDQMFRFGYDRGNFSSVVNRGHLTLRHLLLHGWTASWETLPYPPAHGDFAVYTIDDLEKGINFAVSRYYNAEEEAIGYYIRMKDDKMTATIKYFTFPGFGDTQDDGMNIFDITFPVDAGLTRTVVDNSTLYSYNVTKEFEHLNLSQPMKRMLSTTLQFTLHSVRSHKDSKLATCLQIKGEVIYTDLDNNGQVNVDLETYTTRIKCNAMSLSVEDWELESTLKVVGTLVMAFCIISLLVTILTVAFALYVYRKTKGFMKEYYNEFYGVTDDTEKDLPPSEYFRFFKFWDITVIISDILTLVGTAFVTSETEDQEWMIGTLDSQAFWLGIGCVFAWTSLLRFFKFNIKFHLLFSTLYRAFWDVMAYLLCVIVLFIGFWVCGYVVMGPYHVKFRTPEAAAETLFAIVNGDEIYATLAILESKKSGGKWVFWFSRFYIGSYVAIFTIVVINLLIALFMNAYDSIKEYYADRHEERDLGPMEKALRRYLAQHDSSSNNLRTSICGLLTESGTVSTEETELKRELSKLVRVVQQENDVRLLKPKTLKAFMEDEEDAKKEFNCCCFKCSFVLFSFKK